MIFSRREADEITRLANAGASFKALDFAADRTALLRSNLSRYRIIADGPLPAALRRAQIDMRKQRELSVGESEIIEKTAFVHRKLTVLNDDYERLVWHWS